MTDTLPHSIDVARCYYDQREYLAQDAALLETLIATVNSPNELTSAQWAQWYSVTLGFRPDLIVELGRGRGNSTALFCQAASRLGATRIVSLCNTRCWEDETLPRLRSVVPAGWFDALDARTIDILDVDYEALVKGSQRVLVLWDAHGFEIAEIVLGRIMPLISDRPHLVLMHDISDTRYANAPRSYEGRPLWKSSSWDNGAGKASARVNIGWMNSVQDQVVAVADFAARNDIEIGSADHEYVRFFRAHPAYAAEMTRLVGESFFSTAAHWAFLSLAGRQPPFHFPAVARTSDAEIRAKEVARYYYDQRAGIARDAGLLETLIATVNAPNDLTAAQWAQWYSVALGFRPDLIVELGRSKGNSTALFCQAAQRLGGTRVVSLCNSRDWVDETLPKLRSVVPAGWFDPLDARITDIIDVDFEAVLNGSQRVLVLWDAHGFEIAEIVLGRILPLVGDRPHLVLMHDISDNRYAAVSRSYEDQPIWKGSTWDTGTGKSSARVNIGWMSSVQDQVIAVADFAARNEIEIGSADHEYARFFGARPGYADEMTGLLGPRLFSTSAHWAFLSLAGRQPPLHFPGVSRRFRHQSMVEIRDIHPRPWFGRSRPLPRVVETSSVPWAYASVMAVRSRREPPSDAQRSLRLRVQVDEAPVGIGLLSADRSTFLQSRRLLPAIQPETVWLAIDDPATAGPLVVHTWDEPRSGTVRIDEISMVW
jgi:cephalosporin hydroxylase